MSDELTPITRKETFLAKAGGQNVVTPTPITREETFLQAIIDNGSGGGGGGGAMVITGTVSAGGSHITLDKTWKEIFDAMTSGIVPVVMWEEEDTYKYREPVNSANGSVGQYVVYTYNGVFVTDTENGYPDMSRD